MWDVFQLAVVRELTLEVSLRGASSRLEVISLMLKGRGEKENWQTGVLALAVSSSAHGCSCNLTGGRGCALVHWCTGAGSFPLTSSVLCYNQYMAAHLVSAGQWRYTGHDECSLTHLAPAKNQWIAFVYLRFLTVSKSPLLWIQCTWWNLLRQKCTSISRSNH